MRQNDPRRSGRRHGRQIRRFVALSLLATTTTGCTDLLDGLLSVEAPSNVDARSLENPANARLLVDGAIADFECALAEYVVVGGLIGNELADAQQSAPMWDFDRRSIIKEGGLYATNTCDSGLGAYKPIATARWAADHVLEKLENWSDAEVSNRAVLTATAAAYSGYSHILLGEGFCTAAVDGGPELGRDQVFERAEQRFTRAIELAESTGRSDLLNMARVGRARARLNRGDKPGAAEDARRVPEGFSKNANYSSAAGRAMNRVYVMNRRSRSISVDRTYRNLTFGGVDDPRVQLVDTGVKGANGQTPIWEAAKYASDNSPIAIATWEEAQLIIAEAEGGQAAVEIIDALHARAGLPPFDGSDPQEIMQQIVEERRRELFLEGHHLYDIVRYQIPLDPAPGTPFVNGGLHGDQTCMPLPDIERLNNPNIGE